MKRYVVVPLVLSVFVATGAAPAMGAEEPPAWAYTWDPDFDKWWPLIKGANIKIE